MSGKAVAMHPRAAVVAKVGPRVGKQTHRLLALGRMGIPVPDLIASGDDWAIWGRVRGPLLADVARPIPALERRALLRLCQQLTEFGLHVGDLHVKNLAWCPDREQWVIVDCGAIRRKSQIYIRAALQVRLLDTTGLQAPGGKTQ